MRYPILSVRMIIIKITKEKSLDEDVEKLGPLHPIDGDRKWYSQYEKHDGSSSKKLKQN